MSNTRIIVCVIAIAVMAINTLHITIGIPEVVGLVVVVPFLTAAIYRAMTVFGAK
jgi:hypothetical protein